MSYFRTQLEEWLKQISVKAEKVLDVGGAQLPVSTRLASFEVSKYEILDIPEPHEIHPWAGANIPIIKGDIQFGVDELMHGQYDVVFCLEVMEYIFDPMRACKTLYELLRPGGILYISFPFLYPIHKPIGSDFLRYTEEGTRKLLDVAGFDVAEFRPRVARNPQFLRAFYSSDGMHSRHDETEAHTGYLVKAVKRP